MCPPHEPDAGATPATLLQRVQALDPEGWARAVNLYTPLVLWWCRRRGLIGPRGHDAEDVLQEVFRTVAAKVSAFVPDGRPGAFRRWLYAITDRKLREYWGDVEPLAVGGGSLPHPPAPADDSDDGAAAPERCLLVRRALELTRSRCEERTWEAVWKVVVEGREFADVAVEFGMTVGALHTAKSRVLARLREEYEALLE